MKSQQGQNLELKNAELEKQLADKNRDLEIEAALERVRTVAMGMRAADDLLNICKILFEELTALGFGELRNAMINIVNDEKGSFLNYDFNGSDASVTPFQYNSHPVIDRQIEITSSAGDAFIEHILTGDDLEDFKAFRVRNGESADPKLENISALYYYFYSIGVGSVGISAFNSLPEEKREVLKRFRNVFDLAYRRYADIQLAEAQAREAQIELGLERVRARAMAMQSSGELSDLVTTVFNELSKLDFTLSACIINIIDGESLSNTVWFTGLEAGLPPQRFHMKFEGYPFHDAQWIAWKEKKAKWVYTLQGQEKLTYDEYLLNETEFSKISDAAKADIRAMEKIVCSYTFCNFGGLQTVGTEPLSDVNLDILARFGKVFDLTYTRFNDLKKAEAQAREAQIELALERIRARTMAMQHSDELAETAFILFQQFKELGENPDQATIGIINEEEHVIEYWVTMYGSQINKVFKFSIDEPNVTHKIYKGWKAKKKSLVIDLSGKALLDFATYRQSMGGAELNKGEKRRVINVAFFSKGLINVQSNEARSEESIRLLERFAGVFDGTYTRFLDLKKAEAQAREAQIELSLERVRAGAMSMHHSDELSQVLSILFEQFDVLDIRPVDAHLDLFDLEKNTFSYRATGKEGTRVIAEQTVDLDSRPEWQSLAQRWKQGKPQTVDFSYYPKEVIADLMAFFPDIWAAMPPESIMNPEVDFPDGIYDVLGYCKFGYLGFHHNRKTTEEENRILIRFTNEFERLYKRFLDLKKAEAQARESQIELALERVRARTMAMQHSEELPETAAVLFQQFTELGEEPIQTTIGIVNEAEGVIEFSVTDWRGGGSQIAGSFKGSIDEPTLLNKEYTAWKAKRKSLVVDLAGQELQDWIAYRNVWSNTIARSDDTYGRRVVSFAFFSKGHISISTGEPPPVETIRLLERFAGVFDGTYTRFLDLQKAEAQARESQIELALERVRAKTMAMQKSEELLETSQLVFQQLRELGATADQIGIAIVKEKEGVFELFATLYGNQMLRVFMPKIDDPFVMGKVYKGWKAEQKSFVVELSGEDLRNYNILRNKLGGSNFYNENIGPGDRWIVNCASFSKGILSFSSSKEPAKETTQLLERFAGVFDGTYTRFLDLEKAEAQAKEAQIELALERVRARTMAMQKSGELKEIIKVVYEQLVHLNILAEHAGFIMDYRANDNMNIWLADKHFDPSYVSIPYFDSPHWNSFVEAKKKGTDFFANLLSFEEKNKFYHDLFALVPGVTDEAMQFYLNCPGLAGSTVLLDNVGLYIENFSGIPYTDEENSTLMRFGKVFQQTYTRFLDLQKAEAQAREAQIETALEKVRSRSLAMHKTDELQQVVNLVLEKLQEMGITTDSVAIGIQDEKNKSQVIWIAVNGIPYPQPVMIPYNDDPISSSGWNAWLSRVDYFAKAYSFDEKNQFYNWAFEHSDLKYMPAERKAWVMQSPGCAYSWAMGKVSAIWAVSYSGKLLDAKEAEILKRFGRVFEQAYIRFLDLQKAEAQAREAQIELSLERVRASAMAMHKTDQLLGAAELLYKELTGLGINSMAVTYAIMTADEKSAAYYSINPVDGKINPVPLDLLHTETDVMRSILSSWKKQETFSKLELDEKATLQHQTYIAEIIQAYFAKHNFDYDFSVEAFLAVSPKKAVIYTFNFSQGYIFIIGSEHLTKPQEEMVTRFAKVFEMTYRRFLDLKQAEEQTRESQIQLALERVRARTMAMQKSEELHEVIQLVFDQLHQLNFNIDVANFTLNYRETDDLDLWLAVADAEYPMRIHLPYFDHPIFTRFNKAKGKGGLFTDTLSKPEKNSFFKHFFKYIPGVTKERQALVFGHPGLARSAVFMKNTVLTMINYQGIPFSEAENNTLLRFGQVFDQTYTRFSDLEQAEAQAREAQIQLGLERVRAKAMAMQTSEELNELIGTVFGELTKLDFVLTRCLIMIFDPETKASRWWMANSEAPAEPMNYLVQNHKSPAYDAYLKAWKERNLKWRYALKGKVKRDWDDFLFVDTELAQLPGPVIAGMKAPEQVLLSASFNNFGCLTLVTLEPLSGEYSDIMLRFAKVFDMCYTRFNDLKQAEEQAREAKTEASLERVRSRTMAMQHSDELRDVIQVIYEQLRQLNFNIDSADFNLDYRDSDDFNLWVGVPGRPYPAKLHIPYIDHPLFNRVVRAKVKVPAVIADCYTSDQKNTYFQHNFKFSPTLIPAERQNFILSGAGLAISTVLMTNVALSTMNYSGVPYTDADNATLMRFGKVFEQTYTRFKDLEQAEAQAKESQIQLALERIRARTMAMQHSDELAETASVLFQQLHNLGISSERTFIGMPNDDTRKIELWGTEQGGNQMSTRFEYEADATYAFREIYKAWQEKRSELTVILKGKNLEEHVNYVRNVLHMPLLAALVQKQRILYNAFFSKGLLMIVTPDAQPKETLEILERFAAVFDQTYTRFLDLQKAEAQARESHIQLALERIRARTMAMQRSEELAETATVLFQQLHNLDIIPERVFIGFPNDGNRIFDFWGTEQGGNQMSTRFEVEANSTHGFRSLYKAWKDKKNEFTIVLKGKDLAEHVNYISNILHMPLKKELVQSQRILYNSFFSRGLLMLVTPEVQPEETLNILQRFAAVFDQTYTRFLDLQKAEAQVREGQIEAALERVRSKTMAMHNSDDVGDTVAVMFNELIKLGVEKAARCGIAILDEARIMELWTARFIENEKADLVIGHIDMRIHPLLMAVYDAWKNKESSFSYELAGDDLSAYITAINNYPDYPIRYDISLLGSRQFNSDFFFPEGMLFVFTSEPLDEGISSIFKRFAGVFGQTYRRYLDLQKAEAAAREAQIEAALERVRSKTMAMHNSQDVGDTVGVMFHEFVKLGIEKMIRCGIGIMSHENRTMELWTAKWGENEKVNLLIGHLDMTIHKMLGSIYDAWKSKQSDFTYQLAGSDLVTYAKVINSYPDYPLKYDLNSLPPAQFFNDFSFNEGVVFAFTSNPLSDEIVTVLKRFAGVFGQTYRRYLDLQKAENQAREAQIEAALERVRGKAMAMYTSADLSMTTGMVFSELRKLGIVPLRCGVILPSKDSPVTQLYVATPTPDSHSLDLRGTITLSGHWDMENQYQAWQKKENYFTALKGQELKSYKEVVYSMLPVPYSKSYHEEFGYYLYFSEGFLFAWAGNPFSESELNILNRFKAIIDLTFRRYIELQKSEANTKEAVKQASLDRVRAEIASMRKRSDLERITPLIWDELTILGIPFIRCGVFIMDEEQKLIHTFLSTPDGKAIGAFHVPFDTSGNFEKMVDSWRHDKPYIDHWKEEAFAQFADTLVKQGAIASKAQYMRTLPHEGVHLNFLPFLQGMLYVGNVSPLTEDNINLIQSVADAFSTAYARYEDFNKLEAAKQQVDNTLADLKATQTRLIQSEKMASLGELTAGIAHEIQNPLNFVNNFSEVNQEMIDELAEELKAGNIEEALAIAADIKTNEEKINHHGKRADGIVKGMLQHSRTGGAEKQMTSMNVLADEFMRLSYHGLRAKDKTFNSEMITHFDPDLPKLNVIGQDMGRVMLNLFNNAFYAVNQKQKKAGSDYKPEVTVTTSTEDGHVTVRVKDNGMGMPDAIKEKIMQPFFTTKPTGEGTGLGLSLTYDMVVKGHGGSIQVNSVEGEGSEFVIQLPIG